MAARVILSWGSGKDCAWALHVLRQQSDIEVVALLTSTNEAFDRVAMHGVRRSLVEAQASAAGLPLWHVPLPWPCANEQYEHRMRQAFARARSADATHMAFGDLFLQDVRRYRINLLRETGIEPMFPLWDVGHDTLGLAHEMLRTGLRAVVTCVDPTRLPHDFVGREFDRGFLSDIPASVDPCGENGEFHTFCFDGPMFTKPMEVAVGEKGEREGFWFADVLPAATFSEAASSRGGQL